MRPIKKITVSLAVLGCMISTPGFAQDIEKGVLAGGSQDSTSGLSSPGMEMLVGSDSSSISATFRLDRDTTQRLKVGKDYLRLQLTAPLNKTTKRGDFITSSGFANDFAAKLSWSRVSVDVPFKRRIHSSLQAAAESSFGRCNEIFAKAPKIKATIQQRICGDLTKAEEIGKEEGKQVLSAELISALKKLDQDVLDEELGFISDFAVQPIWYYGIEASAGYEKHAFRNPIDSTKLSEEKVSYAVSGYMGVTPKTENLYLGGGFTHKVSYDDATAMTRCGTPDENGFQDCVTASYAAPEKNTDSTVFGLLRFEPEFMKVGKERAFGLEVKAAYDFEDDKFAIGAPLYLFQDKDKKLSGGVRLDWDNKSKDVIAGVFVGSSFSLLGSN